MFRNKISTIPIILIIIGFGGLTLMSCAASSQEALKKRTPRPFRMWLVRSLRCRRSLWRSESALNKKTDLLEKGGEERPLHPENDPPAVNTDRYS